MHCKSLNPVTAKKSDIFKKHSPGKDSATSDDWRTLIIPAFSLSNNLCSVISVLKMSIPQKSMGNKAQGVPSTSKSRGRRRMSLCPLMDLRPWVGHGWINCVRTIIITISCDLWRLPSCRRWRSAAGLRRAGTMAVQKCNSRTYAITVGWANQYHVLCGIKTKRTSMSAP